MMQLGSHLQSLENEKHKLRAQVKRLCQENSWLRDELASAQKKLHECEQSNATYAVEIEHLKFLKDVKQQFDVTETNSSSTLNLSETPSTIQTNDFVNELFSNDDDICPEQHNESNSRRIDSSIDLSMSPYQSANGSFVSTTGYEIPSRLKTLHNLVIQYASQGRYEVAVPLCRQALEDLERTSGHQRKKNLLFEKKKPIENFLTF